MNYLLSYRAYGLICAVILCIVIATMACVGCAAPRAVQEYGVDAFTIKVASRATIQKEWDKHEAYKRVQVRGFYDEMTRTVWVERGYGGRPDLFTLGHEVWHLSELGGNYHE